MSEPRPTHAKYVFLDVVNFTKERSIEVQTDIVRDLNKVVKSAVAEHKIPGENIIYLPTGDGICVVLLDLEKAITHSPFDLHLQLALTIIRGVHEHNSSAPDEQHKFQVRIGVNEDFDNVVIDINGSRNMAGSGINDAQRIMSLAEGNQVFIGQRVHMTLYQRDRYMRGKFFHPYKVTVKHDIPIRVYQYIEEGNPGLNTNVEETLKKEEAVDLFNSATKCGLKRIYYSRDEVAQSVRNDVERAQKRIWLLGIGLSEKINLTELLPKLNAKIDTADVRILLLDGLRSPALFRTFLEIPADTFRHIIETNREKKPPLSEPYCDQRLYRTFQTRCSELKKLPKLQRAVKFYGHSPTCWLVIVDNTAYFQPYMFGRGVRMDDDDHDGPPMPIFKFQVQEREDTQAFDILSDHFNKLWLTSNTDLFHIGGEMVDKWLILRDIFRQRHYWFRHVYGALHGNNGEDRRHFPRKPCVSDPHPATHIEWQDENGAPQSEEATRIVNFSREDMLLEMKNAKHPAEGAVVKLVIQPVGGDSNAAEYFKKEFLEPCHNKFDVMRVYNEQTPLLIALHARHE